MAIEAVWNGDPVNERGYAVGATSYYVNDTVFAEMIREAVATGYTIVPYDQICIVEVGDGRKPDSVPYDRIEVDRQSTVVVYAPHIRASASTDEALATVRIFGLDGELLGQRNLD